MSCNSLRPRQADRPHSDAAMNEPGASHRVAGPSGTLIVTGERLGDCARVEVIWRADDATREHRRYVATGDHFDDDRLAGREASIQHGTGRLEHVTIHHRGLILPLRYQW